MPAMHGYAYRALRQDGTMARGQIDATSTGEALAALDRDGLLAVDVRQVASPSDRRTEIPAADLAVGLSLLAETLEAGMPVMRALQTLDDVAPATWRGILPHLRDSVREGKSLGAAFRDSPTEIPALVVGMTIAGEMAGEVGAAVRRAAEITESMAETRAAVRNALAYPLLLAVAGTGAIGLMIGVVIPRFAAILVDVSQSLPASTRIVMQGAEMLRASAVPAAVTTAVSIVAIQAWGRTKTGRRRLDALLLHVPFIGAVRRANATARVSVTLATLLDTGVSLRHAIGLAADAGGDASIGAAVRAAGRRMESGQSVASAFRDSAALTPLVLRMMQAGEESGRLSSMLRHGARLEHERGERLTRTAVRLLEPALILVFGGLVALVAAALLQAVYAVRPAP